VNVVSAQNQDIKLCVLTDHLPQFG